MVIIQFPVLCLCRNVLKRANTTVMISKEFQGRVGHQNSKIIPTFPKPSTFHHHHPTNRKVFRLAKAEAPTPAQLYFVVKNKPLRDSSGLDDW